MRSHAFDPWAEIQRLRERKGWVAKPANAAKPEENFSQFSHFSRKGLELHSAQGCPRCQGLEAKGVVVLRCLGCGYRARKAGHRAIPTHLVCLLAFARGRAAGQLRPSPTEPDNG